MSAIRHRGSVAAGLKGLFLHTLDDSGEVRLQGRIIGFDGGDVLVQLYSWIDGGITNVEALAREFIYSDKCRLYADHDVWVTRGAESSRRLARKFSARLERGGAPQR